MLLLAACGGDGDAAQMLLLAACVSQGNFKMWIFSCAATICQQMLKKVCDRNIANLLIINFWQE